MLSLFSLSHQFPRFLPFPLHMHVYACGQMRTHTRRHARTQTHRYATKFVLPPTSKLAPALLMHTHTCIHTSVTIICMQSGWLRWVAMVAVMWQEAASCFTSYWRQCKGVTNRAEEAITSHKSAHSGRRNNRDGDDAALYNYMDEIHQRCTVRGHQKWKKTLKTSSEQRLQEAHLCKSFI